MKPIEGVHAIDELAGALRKLGFWQADQSRGGSRYLRHGRAPWKLRLSDHALPQVQRARHCEIVLDVVAPRFSSAAEVPAAALDTAIRFAALARLRTETRRAA